MQHRDLGFGEGARGFREQTAGVLQIGPEYEVEELGRHLVVRDVGVILVEGSGTGAQLFEVLILIVGLLFDVTSALEGLHPLPTHQSDQASRYRIGQQTALFESEDDVEQAFHSRSVKHTGGPVRPASRLDPGEPGAKRPPEGPAPSALSA